MSCSHNSSHFFGALLTGIAIGGILGVLYAPIKGSDLRKKLTCRTDESDPFTDSIKEKFNDLVDEIRDEIEEAKHTKNVEV